MEARETLVFCVNAVALWSKTRAVGLASSGVLLSKVVAVANNLDQSVNTTPSASVVGKAFRFVLDWICRGNTMTRLTWLD